MSVLLSRITKVSDDWVVDDPPLTFDDADGDPAEAQAHRWGERWRAEDPENHRYVIEEMP